MDSSRVNNKWPVAREGFPFILTGILLSVLLYAFSQRICAAFSILLTVFVVYFFRDPDRSCAYTPNTVVSPADGRIIKIQQLDEKDNPLGEPAVLISVFMSLLNVHVNRIPISGMVGRKHYHPGKFFSANLDKASEQNERNSMILTAHNSRNIVVTQIAGLVARRIVCWANEGDRVETGQRFGLIRFGSRLDVYLPVNSRVIARNRQKVKAGQTIIGYLS